jgi:hydrogenase nickel incorporation protein HypA/HybF
MHELAATERLLAQAEQQASSADGRLTDVHVVLGELSTITEEAVRFYWNLLSAGRPSAEARLHFRPQPAAWRCLDCAQGQGAGLAEQCPACGSYRLHLTGGQDCYLEAIDIADPAAADLPPAPP